jgi:folate-dependent phosphoribosylglycinamide formyltransferase PurN
MRLAVLTTETLHHAYFVRELSRHHPIQLVMGESSGIIPPFDITHSFEASRDVHERDTWFGGLDVDLASFAPTSAVRSMNDPAAVQQLRDTSPDVVIVFGTGKLHPPVIDLCPHGIVNLHGGDPENYRGLDTHLWAIYHRDFSALVTTLHGLTAELDDGEIVGRHALPLSHGMRLHELRRVNTEVCVRLVTNALEGFARRGHFASRPQTRCGRYYSFMPSVLKALCVQRFEKYTTRLG